jgi:hypothetical protein
MRGRVIPFRVAPPVAGHSRDDVAEVEGAGDSPDRRRPPFDLADFVDVDAPAFADDFSLIGDLAAGFGVERRFAQQHRDPPAVEMPNGRRLRFDLDRVVSDERRRRAPPQPRRSVELRQVRQRVECHADALRLSFLLRTSPLLIERRFEPGDVDDVAALARHQLGEIDREAERVVQPERVLAADRTAHIGSATD